MNTACAFLVLWLWSLQCDMDELDFEFVEEKAELAEPVDDDVERDLAANRSNEAQPPNHAGASSAQTLQALNLPSTGVSGGNQGSLQWQNAQRDSQQMAVIEKEGGASTPWAQRTTSTSSQHVVLVSKRQQKNPLLKCIRNVRWQFGDIVPDYMLGNDTCALFLSLRYHLLEPEYIYGRIAQLQRSFRVRVLLCHVDVPDVVKPLGEVTKIAIYHDCTLICAWSYKECARYLETFKCYETKPADGIQERVDNDFASRLTAALTAIKGINKTDSAMLGSTLGSLAKVMTATKEEMSACPGIGPTKLQRLHDTFQQPFYFGRGASHREAPTSSQNKGATTITPEVRAHPKGPPGRVAAKQYQPSRKRSRKDPVQKMEENTSKNSGGEKSSPTNDIHATQGGVIPLDIEEF